MNIEQYRTLWKYVEDFRSRLKHRPAFHGVLLALRNLLFCPSMAFRNRFTRFVAALLPLCGFLLTPSHLQAQQASPAPSPSGAAPAADMPEFLAAADEILQEMSRITGWELKTPLKKSLRSREEIRAYVLRQMDDEKDTKERYASARSAEAFGLIPKDFNLDTFMVDLLTEQIAGLYDPKAHEFYIADWIPADEQRMVMSHELTHALEDQHFQIENWVKAARPNDDAEMARDSVLEGSAMAAMLEYELKDKGIKLRDLPEFDPSVFMGDLADTPMLKKAPPFIKDSLMFPYFSGLTFSMAVLRSSGWPGFASVFANPPANTQQILHPELYFAHKVPAPLKLDLPATVPGDDWVLLEQNSLGEFGWDEVLKQFAGGTMPKTPSAPWAGDAYATFEGKNSKQLLLFTRLRLQDAGAAHVFFSQYSQTLANKYPDRFHTTQGENSLSFESSKGTVYFRCHGDECITLENGTSGMFLQWLGKLGWPLLPKAAPKSDPALIQTTMRLAGTEDHDPVLVIR